MPHDHTHVVARMYLRHWANSDERIKMVLVQSGDEVMPGINDAGVRAGIYKRERPSGVRSDDIETDSIQPIESAAAPLLADIRNAWPLSIEDKMAMAMFIGLQLVRGPRWFAWHDEFTDANLAGYREQGAFAPMPGEDASEEEIYERNVELHQSATQTLMKMLQLSATAASALGSMNWSLIEFGGPALATSDHPVVVWPISDKGRPPRPTVPASIGLVNFLEVRFPISPNLALLLTWRGQPDEARPLKGGAHHAKNINAFTIAEAEKAWFYKPGTRPKSAGGYWLPISPELVPDYSIRTAQSAPIRQLVQRDLMRRAGKGSLKAEIRYWPHAQVSTT
jgi:hypothetical protein